MQDNFEFKEVVEEKEELNWQHLKPCPHCKKPIPADATMCLYCGQSTAGGSHKPLWVIVTAIILLVSFLMVYVIF